MVSECGRVVVVVGRWSGVESGGAEPVTGSCGLSGHVPLPAVSARTARQSPFESSSLFPIYAVLTSSAYLCISL